MNKHLLCICMAFLVLLCNHNLNGQSDGNHATQADLEYLKSFFTSFSSIASLSSIPSQKTTLPVQVYIVRKSDGSGGISEAQVKQALSKVNQIFSGSSIQFDACNVITIDSDEYFNFDKKTSDVSLTSDNYDNGAINLYCVGTLADKGKVIDSYGSFPASNSFLAVISESAAMSISPLAHQLGHLFGLLDTHESSFGPELASGVTCRSTGDLMCDTPADPGLSGKVDQNCNYTGTDLDHRRDPYNPAVNNIMSSAPNHCRTTFSEDQLEVIYASYKKSMQHMKCTKIQGKPDLVCQEKGTLKVDKTKVTIENIWIGNKGNAQAGSSYVGYYLSKDKTFTTADYLIGEEKIAALTAGKRVEESFFKDVATLEIPAGSYFVGIILDHKGQVAESNESNNNDCYWDTPKVVIKEEEGKPNLVCKERGYLKAKEYELSVSNVWITNNGEGKAGASVLGYYLSKDKNFTTSDYLIGESHIDPLYVGHTAGASFSIRHEQLDNVPAGTYYIGLILDHKNQVHESNELDNNDCYFETPQIVIKGKKPNLACKERGELKIEDGKIKIDNIWIINNGEGMAGKSQIGYYLSKDENFTTSDYRIGSKYVNDLKAGETTSASFHIALEDIHVPNGSYYVGFILDYSKKIVESDEYDNNDCYWTTPKVHINDSKANLACKERGYLKIDGDNLEVTDVWLINNGHSKAGASHLGLYLSKDKEITSSDYLIGSESIKALEAGKTASANFWVKLKEHDIPGGTYYVGLLLDHKNEVYEANEYDNNDCFWQNPQVIIKGEKPNLACKEKGTLKVDGHTVEVDDVWLINNGHSKAGESLLGLYLSKDKHISSSDYRIASKTIKALESGKTASAEFWVNLKEHEIPAGTYYVGLLLDYNNKIHESNEYDNNDCYWDNPKVHIEEEKPNLACKEPGILKVNGLTVEVGDIWLTNNGHSKAGESQLGLYLSKDKHFTTSDIRIASKTVKAIEAGKDASAEFWVDLKNKGIQPGTYYVGLILDYNNKVSEKNESDNNDCYWDNPTVHIEEQKPNLACKERGNLKIDGHTIEVDDIWLTNNGHAKAGESLLGLYLSKDKHFTTSDVRIASKTIKAIEAGKDASAEFWVKLDDHDIAPGTYYVGLILDYNNKIKEKDEYDNNDCFWTNPQFVVKPPKPNLACKERGTLKIDDYKLKISNVWLINNGKGKAEASYLGYYLSKDKHITTSDYRIGSDYIKALNPNETASAHFEIDLDDIHITPGTYYVGLLLDYKNKIAEEDEYDNNDCYWTTPQLVVKPPKPNLACKERGTLKIDDDKLKISNVWLINNGKGKAEASYLGYYLSKDKHISTSDYRIGSDYIEALDPHETASAYFEISLKDIKIEPGTYYVGLLLDYKNKIDEEDEYDNNDCYWTNPQLVVKPPKPDLVCKERGYLHYSNQQLEIEDIWLGNDGHSKAKSSYLGLYLSKDKHISTSDYRIASKYIKELNPGQKTAAGFWIDLKDYEIPPGHYYVGLYLDYKNQVDEEDEYNNNDCFWNNPIEIVEGKPNLTCLERGWLEIDNYNRLEITDVWLKNDGHKKAGGSYLGLYLSKDRHISTSDHLIATEYIKALEPGERTGADFWVDLDHLDLPKGTYYVGLYLDYKNQVHEKDEHDNNDCYWTNPTVKISDKKPNLACKEPGSLKIQGSELSVTNTWLVNNGEGKADGSYVGLYLSKDKYFTTSDIRIGRDYIEALDPNETAGASFWVNLDDLGLSQGTYYVGLILDYQGKIDETNEDDNNDCYWTSEKVTIGGSSGGGTSSACSCNANNDLCETFNGYQSGRMIAMQSSCWTTWNNRPGSDEDAKVEGSGNKYLNLKGNFNSSGSQNVMMKLGDRTSGKYELKFKIQVSSGKNAYYALMHSSGKAHSVVFGSSGTGYLQVGGQRTGFNFTPGSWVSISQIIDLDANQTTLSCDGKAIKSWSFSNSSSGSIGAINFYPTDWTYDFKVDDIYLTKKSSSGFVHNGDGGVDAVANSANLNDGELNTSLRSTESSSKVFKTLTTYPNPTNGLFVVQGQLEATTDVTIELKTIQGAVVHSVQLENIDHINQEFDLSNQASGVYFVNLITNKGIQTKRISVQ